MAREGTTTIVANKEEKDTIKTYESFAWELQNAQSLGNGNVKLVFIRETKQPNYARLVSLEEQYYKIKLNEKMSSSEIASLAFGFILWTIICYVVGAVALQLSAYNIANWGIALGSLAIIFLLLFFYGHRISMKENKVKLKKREEILNTARNLLD